MRYLVILLGLVFLNGCLARTYTTEQPRVDTTIEGNRGYLLGGPKNPKKEIDNKVRKVSVLEIELGNHNLRGRDVEKDIEEAKLKDQAASCKDQNASSDEYAVKEYSGESNSQAVEESSPKEEQYEEYVIKKNDTLQKISKKFYGTTKKWKMLYDKNSDVLKSADKVIPGQKIKIPKA